jgi:Arc/MetJ-type ribon-helix-helix transcriptional regulator
MNVTMRFDGYVERIIDEAVKRGVVKTKAEALRLGVLQLNEKYHLVSQNLSEDEEDLNLAIKIDERIKAGKEEVYPESKLKTLLR